MKQGKNGLVAGVFGPRIYTTQHIPAKITARLFEAKDGKTLTAAKWKRLIIPNYFHAAVFLKVSGFEITRNGISLDVNVESIWPLNDTIDVPEFEKTVSMT